MEHMPAKQIPSAEALASAENKTPINAGHMMYDKSIVTTADANWFVKSNNGQLFSDETEAARTWEYLIKEAAVYDIVQRNGYLFVPAAYFHEESLIMPAHLPEDGWHWEAPAESVDAYAQDVLSALESLEETSGLDELVLFERENTIDLFLNKGWQAINTETIPEIMAKIELLRPAFHQHVSDGVRDVLDMLATGKHIESACHLQRNYLTRPDFVFAHLDARQTNITWHPDHGARLVDWSWASAAPRRADRTMFLIDLHKSDHDVTAYMAEHFDPDYALLIIGYWLARSILPSAPGDETVRFHQLASAVSAADLLLRNRS